MEELSAATASPSCCMKNLASFLFLIKLAPPPPPLFIISHLAQCGNGQIICDN